MQGWDWRVLVYNHFLCIASKRPHQSPLHPTRCRPLAAPVAGSLSPQNATVQAPLTGRDTAIFTPAGTECIAAPCTFGYWVTCSSGVNGDFLFNAPNATSPLTALSYGPDGFVVFTGVPGDADIHCDIVRHVTDTYQRSANTSASLTITA